MLHKVESYIESQKLLTPKSKVIVGLSGGADSVVLLHVLKLAGYTCIAAHCNFQLRDTESNRDESFVTKLTDKMGIPLYKITFDTKEYALQQKISIEMAARDLRYNWFEQLRTKLNADAVAIAHHADDNAETLLLNLVRGTGIRGLCGISAKNAKIVRPLLSNTRQEIQQYIYQNKLEYVTDSSNLQSDFTRNKLRNIIIPQLEEINPSVRQTLNENITRFEDVFKIYEESVREKLKHIANKTDNKILINIGLLKNESAIETILYECIKDFGFHSDQIKSIIQSLDYTSGKIFYSENYRLIKDRKYLMITNRVLKNQTEISIHKNQTEITEPIHLTFKHIKNNSLFEISKKTDCIHIDADLLQFPLKLRNWEEGDFFVPFGMKGKKKISDYFIDEKMSIFDKEETLILLSNEELVWIIGKRSDNRFRISDTTENILEIKIKN
jgi:tRNA(Ile)-lysidine synthase